MLNQLLGASPELAAVRDQLSRLLGRQAARSAACRRS